MITQLLIKPIADDNNLLGFTFDDRDISITLTNQQLDILTDILNEYKNDNQSKTAKIYSVNLN